MAQIFHRSTNSISRATIFGAVFVVSFIFWALAQIQRSPYVTYAGVARPQPVPFSHEHHAGGLGIDCRYCHTSVEKSSFAGIPPTAAGYPRTVGGTPFAVGGYPRTVLGIPFAALGYPGTAVGIPFAVGGIPFAALGTPPADPCIPKTPAGPP